MASGLELYHGVTSCFFGIGILPLTDLLDFRYFGRYRSPLFRILPPFPPPFFFQKGVGALKKGAIAPLFRKKGGTAPFLIPKSTDRVFLRYRYGKYREIPTEYRPKIPIRDTTLEMVQIRRCAYSTPNDTTITHRVDFYVDVWPAAHVIFLVGHAACGCG